MVISEQRCLLCPLYKGNHFIQIWNFGGGGGSWSEGTAWRSYRQAVSAGNTGTTRFKTTLIIHCGSYMTLSLYESKIAKCAKCVLKVFLRVSTCWWLAWACKVWSVVAAVNSPVWYWCCDGRDAVLWMCVLPELNSSSPRQLSFAWTVVSKLCCCFLFTSFFCRIFITAWSCLGFWRECKSTVTSYYF